MKHRHRFTVKHRLASRQRYRVSRLLVFVHRRTDLIDDAVDATNSDCSARGCQPPEHSLDRLFTLKPQPLPKLPFTRVARSAASRERQPRARVNVCRRHRRAGVVARSQEKARFSSTARFHLPRASKINDSISPWPATVFRGNTACFQFAALRLRPTNSSLAGTGTVPITVSELRVGGHCVRTGWNPGSSFGI